MPPDSKDWTTGLDAQALRMVRLLVVTICAAYNVSWSEMRFSLRRNRVVAARKWLILLLYEDAGLSLVQIGRLLGRKHSSVYHCLADMRTRLEEPRFCNIRSKLARTFARVNRCEPLCDEGDVSWYEQPSFGQPLPAFLLQCPLVGPKSAVHVPRNSLAYLSLGMSDQ